MMIHQIWLGGNMPAQEQEWTAGVRAGAEAAGHEYRLWTDRELEDMWGQYAHWRFFGRRACPLGQGYSPSPFAVLYDLFAAC